MAPVSLPGAATLFPTPGQQQPFPAAWASPLGAAPQAPPPGMAPCPLCHPDTISTLMAMGGGSVGAPEGAPGPARLLPTHTGLHRAPCGCCCFNPSFFHIEWTTTNAPAPATTTLGHGTAALPGAALWGPGGCGTLQAWAAPGTPQGQPPLPPVMQLPAYGHQGTAVPAAPTLLLTSIPGRQHLKGQPAGTNSSGTATLVGLPPARCVPMGTCVPPRPATAPDKEAPGGLGANIDMTEETLLQEPLRLLGSTLDTVEVAQDPDTRITMPGDPGGIIREGRTVAPAPTQLPTSIPAFENTKEWSSETNSSSRASRAQTPLGSDISWSTISSPKSNISPRSDISSESDITPELTFSPKNITYSEQDISQYDSISLMTDTSSSSNNSWESDVPHSQALRDAAGHLESDVPRSPSAVPHSQALRDRASHLAVPQEVPVKYFSMETTRKAVVVLEDIFSRTTSQEPCGDTGMELPPAQSTMAEKRGTKPGTSSPSEWLDYETLEQM
ncbi:uncharacterized protein LOC134525904 [Chroicocephalus ridibundus]|uniref:uncharacterized protein LOC134525904 n=1 Tax=Chroicocephalus ridibundus TaxID=1192867 RepID=UPI002FDE255B